MNTIQWVKPLFASDIPEGTYAVWDVENEIWTYVPINNPQVTYEIIPITTLPNNP
jgi:hypothetical protein